MSAIEMTGVTATLAEIRQALDDLRQEAVDETLNAGRTLMEELFSHTPVWSGRAVRNFSVGVNGTPGGGENEPIGGPEGPRPSDPSEPRRAANEDAARAEMEAVFSGVHDLVSFHFGNAARNWDLVDSGTAPTPDRSRAPGGVSLLAEAAARSALGDHWA